MSRVLYAIERGLRFYGVNGDTGPSVLFGTGAPGGDAGDQDNAEVGSQYTDQANGASWKKITAGTGADKWLRMANINDVNNIELRGRVIAVTTEDVGAGVRDLTASPFTDDDTPFLDATDFQVGDLIIDDAAGSPQLLEVTAVSAPNVTFAAASPALTAGDKFVATYYLPDTPNAQEAQALVYYDGSALIKLADFNWALADGINTTGGWTPTDGAPSAGETLESVTEKIESAVLDILTTLGVARNAENLGAFSSPASLLFAATYTVKSAFQRVGDLLAQLRGVEATGITTEATVDSVPVASVKAVKWIIEAFEEATPANRKALEVLALNDGNTTVTDNASSILKVGANFNLVVSVDIDTGNMRLRVASGTAGVTVRARRIEVVKNVL